MCLVFPAFTDNQKADIFHLCACQVQLMPSFRYGSVGLHSMQFTVHYSIDKFELSHKPTSVFLVLTTAPKDSMYGKSGRNTISSQSPLQLFASKNHTFLPLVCVIMYNLHVAFKSWKIHCMPHTITMKLCSLVGF